MTEKKDDLAKSNRIRDKFVKLKRRIRKESGGFLQHLAPFVFVNGFLFFLNMFTSPSYPWFLFPLGGWSIGLVSHLFISLIRKKQSKELAKIPDDINEEQYSLIKKITDLESGIYGHIGPFISTNAFLIMIYSITSPGGYPWFVFPLAGWGFGFFMHLATSIPKMMELKKRLKEMDIDYLTEPVFMNSTDDKGNVIRNQNGFMPSDEENRNNYLLALRIQKTLSKKIASNPDLQDKLELDIEKNISNYIDHIRQLIERDEEISLIVSKASFNEIEEQIKELSKKHENTDHEALNGL